MLYLTFDYFVLFCIQEYHDKWYHKLTLIFKAFMFKPFQLKSSLDKSFQQTGSYFVSIWEDTYTYLVLISSKMTPEGKESEKQ